jgi:hypothetical protein
MNILEKINCISYWRLRKYQGNPKKVPENIYTAVITSKGITGYCVSRVLNRVDVTMLSYLESIKVSVEFISTFYMSRESHGYFSVSSV